VTLGRIVPKSLVGVKRDERYSGEAWCTLASFRRHSPAE
jgi:hypothetical protein